MMSISTSPKKVEGTNPAVARRAMAVPPSPIRKLADFAVAAKERGTKVYHLNIGQPDIPTPPVFFEALREFPEKVVAYGHSKGSAELRKAWSRYYERKGLDVRPEQIQITTGGSEAMLFGLLLVTDPGDNVILSEPFYTNYLSLATAVGAEIRPVTADPKTGFHLPPRERIEAAIDDRTRAIVICTPNNPTGTVLDRDEVATIVQIAAEHKLFVLSDEVYREFCYEGEHTSIWQFPQIGDRAIILDSISKRFSACGARVGALVSRNEDVIDSALRLGQARLCTPTIEQFAAVRLMELGEDYFKRMTDEYRGRRNLMMRLLKEIPGVHCKNPSGAFYMMVTLPVDSTEDFCRWMLTDFSHDGQTVMTAPGPGFYATPGQGTQEARIAYVLEQPELEKAVTVLAAGLEAYPGRQA